jgi:hypothetical protein
MKREKNSFVSSKDRSFGKNTYLGDIIKEMVLNRAVKEPVMIRKGGIYIPDPTISSALCLSNAYRLKSNPSIGSSPLQGLDQGSENFSVKDEIINT